MQLQQKRTMDNYPKISMDYKQKPLNVALLSNVKQL